MLAFSTIWLYCKTVEPLSEAKVKGVFLKNKARFSARKIKQLLENQEIQLSRRRIRRIMKGLNLETGQNKNASYQVFKNLDRMLFIMERFTGFSPQIESLLSL